MDGIKWTALMDGINGNGQKKGKLNCLSVCVSVCVNEIPTLIFCVSTYMYCLVHLYGHH
jgi:hypothetical protein